MLLVSIIHAATPINCAFHSVKSYLSDNEQITHKHFALGRLIIALLMLIV